MSEVGRASRAAQCGNASWGVPLSGALKLRRHVILACVMTMTHVPSTFMR
jgi:hypothetical protein